MLTKWNINKNLKVKEKRTYCLDLIADLDIAEDSIRTLKKRAREGIPLYFEEKKKNRI